MPGAVKRVGLAGLIAIGLWMWPASAPLAGESSTAGPMRCTEASVEVLVEEEEEEDLPQLGFLLDAGVPDGANLAVAWRPYHWLRLHAGGSYNRAGFGLRAGGVILPFEGWITPSLAIDVGHFFKGDLRGLMSDILGRSPDGVPQQISYTYANLHLGLEMGTESITFYLRAGYSLLDALTTPSAESVSEGIRFEEDARIRALTPSAKLGFVIYLI